MGTAAGGGQSSRSRHRAPSPCTCTATRGADVDRRVAEQVPVEPRDVGVGRTFTATVEVPAAADAQSDGPAVVAEGDEVVAHARERRVEPAVDEQRRHRPPFDVRLEVERRPVRIVRGRMRDLLLEERVVLAGDVEQRIAHRKVVERGDERLLPALDALQRDVLRESAAFRVQEVQRARDPS